MPSHTSMCANWRSVMPTASIIANACCLANIPVTMALIKFNIPINAYVLINMGGLKTIINKVGGVDITPNLSFTYEGYTFTKGEKTHMDGAKALAYSRMRYDDPEGDYGRQKRQRQILAALMKKAESATTLLNTSFISSLSKQVQTDMTSLAKN